MTFLIILILGWLVPEQSLQAADPVNISADSAILLEVANGQVLYHKKGFQTMAPASTTKILTAIVAIENKNNDSEIMIGEKPTRIGGSTLGLKRGSIFTFEDLLKATLICSANDASLALGEYIGGDEATFIYMMNRKLLSLGAYSSNFKNTHGLSAAGHFTSAYDLALIARYALQNKEFADIVKIRQSSIADGKYLINNTNRLLGSFVGADGVKTGTTRAAGQCLVASATRDGRQLIAVVLHSNNRFQDASNLLEYGFKAWREGPGFKSDEVMAVLPVTNGENETVEAILSERLGVSYRYKKEEIQTIIEIDQAITAPIESGKKLGDAILLLNGHEVQRVSLIARQKIDKGFIWRKMRLKQDF